MNKKTIYSLSLIVLFVAIGAILLKNNRVQKETFEQSGPVSGATNIDISDIQAQHPDEDATLLPETWERIDQNIKKNNK